MLVEALGGESFLPQATPKLSRHARKVPKQGCVRCSISRQQEGYGCVAVTDNDADACVCGTDQKVVAHAALQGADDDGSDVFQRYLLRSVFAAR